MTKFYTITLQTDKATTLVEGTIDYCTIKYKKLFLKGDVKVLWAQEDKTEEREDPRVFEKQLITRMKKLDSSLSIDRGNISSTVYGVSSQIENGE